MRVYVDTSVVLRRLFNESGLIPTWGRWERAYISQIWLIEAKRTVDRLRLEGRIADADVARLRSEIGIIHETFYVIPVSEAILYRAGESFPTVLGTLDAIHLASALTVNTALALDRFLTHDRRLAIAARSMGLMVEGV